MVACSRYATRLFSSAAVGPASPPPAVRIPPRPRRGGAAKFSQIDRDACARIGTYTRWLLAGLAQLDGSVASQLREASNLAWHVNVANQLTSHMQMMYLHSPRSFFSSRVNFLTVGFLTPSIASIAARMSATSSSSPSSSISKSSP